MASSNIKLFDENKGNMLSDSEFSISNQRMNGLQTGVASSQLQNKAMYQASLVAYAIAQVMMQNGLNANDTDAVSAFVANLSGTMLQKVYDIATTAEAQAGSNVKKWMSPSLVKAAFNYMKANTSEAQAGTNDTKWMSPALVKAAIDTLAAKAQNILSSSTKALYGLDSSAVPDDVLALIKPLIDAANSNANSKAEIATGSYIGTGTYGSSNQNSLTFDFEPSIVIVYGEGSGSIFYAFLFKGSTISNRFRSTADENGTADSRGLHVNFSGSTVSWYSTIGRNDQLNASGITYKYVVIG